MLPVKELMKRDIWVMLAVVVLAWPRTADAQSATSLVVVSATTRAGADAGPAAPMLTGNPSGAADFHGVTPSAATLFVANWVVSSHDNDGLPFVIIDKIAAKVYVFDKGGRLLGASFALLGAARGDDSVPGIGNMKLSAISPAERTTPAGRYVAALGRDFSHDVLWIDYALSLSLHRVVHGNPGDHRLQRLATTSTLDKRISYGCVNVPAGFYDDVILTAFNGTRGIDYILPEIKTLQQVFPQMGAAHGMTGD